MDELPEEVRAVIAAQGWNEDSVVRHLYRFIVANQIEDSLETWFEESAQEENKS